MMAEAPLLLDVNQGATEETRPDDQATIEEVGPADASIQQEDDHADDEAAALKKHDEPDDEAATKDESEEEAAAIKKQAPLPFVQVNRADLEKIQPAGEEAATEEAAGRPDHAVIQHADDEAAAATEEPGSDDEAAALKKRDDLLRFHLPLNDAALSGVWEDVEKFLNEKPEEADITQVNLSGMTILHVAANLGHTLFIKKLIQSGLFPKPALRLLDNYGWSALHYAARSGNLSAIKILLSEDNSLMQVMDRFSNCSPLHRAASVTDNSSVVWYLIKETIVSYPHHFSGLDGANVVGYLVRGRYYDVVLYLFNSFPQLPNDSVDNGKVQHNNDILHSLVRQSSDFPSGSTLSFGERCIYHFIPIETPILMGASPPQQFSTITLKLTRVMYWIFGAVSKAIVYLPHFKRIRDEKYKHRCIILLLEVACKAASRWDVNDIAKYLQERKIHYSATVLGGTEAIKGLIKHFPHNMNDSHIQIDVLLWSIKHRQERVFNIMMQRGVSVTFFGTYVHKEAKESILHVAGKLAPYARLTSVSSPALQMQRELQWFQAVEKIAYPATKTNTNINRHNPRALFTIEHKDLVKDAERWMKDTANSCLVVAALIITVVFAAAFTIPGGNIDGTGVPLFLRRSDFMVFIVSDAIGMFSSATSILMFLSILTARYAEDDFLRALPKRLILGLVSLLIALASMTIAFGAALYIALHPRFNWIISPIIGLTCIPVCLFIMLQLPLVIYMVRSTYGPSLLKVNYMAYFK